MKTLNVFIIALAIIMGIFACTFTPDKKILPKQAGGKQISEASASQQISDSIVREKRLISNCVRCVATDTNNVWIATDKGVSRFLRGKNIWTHYTKADGLADDDINAVAIDGNYVWFATNAGVSRYDVTKDKLGDMDSTKSEGVIRNFRRKDGLVSDEVACIAVDGNYVWFGTNQGLSRYDKTIDSWATRAKKDGLVSNDVRTIAVEDEYVWVGMVKEEEKDRERRFRTREEMKPKTGGVSRYHRTTDSWNNYTKADGLIDDELSIIAVDEEFVWFGTQNAGISVYSKTDQTFVKTYTNTDLLVSNKISSIVADGNQVWFGTRNGGVQRYVRSVDTWMRYTTDDGLAGDHVTWIAVSGNEVWFSTEQSGVSRFNKVTGKWTIYSKADWLADNDVRCIESLKDKLWIGAADGLSQYDINLREWTTYGKNDGLTTNYITTVKAINDEIWVGTPRGLARLLNTREWKFYCQKDKLKDEFVTAIAKSVSEDAIWVGTSNGLYKFDLVENQCESFVNKDGLPADMFASLTDDFVLRVTAIAFFDVRIWVGTSNGLFSYDPEERQATLYLDDKGLGDNYVNTIEPTENELWVGTRGGLSRYDSSSDSFFNYTEQNGLPNLNVKALCMDDARYTLWIGTPKGLAALLFKGEVKVAWTPFETDGQCQNLSDIVNENIKCIRLCQGKLWVGTTTGMIEFQPETNAKTTYRSQKTVEPFLESNIENIELDGDYIWFSNWAASKNGCIIRYNKSTGTWQKYTRIDILHSTKSQSMTNIRRIYVDNSDVWFATDYGALRYEKASDTWTHYTTADGLSSNELNYIAVTTKSVWMSDAGGGGISRYDKKTGTWTSLSLESKFPFESITCIAADGDDIWFALETGVHKFNETTGTFRKYTQKDGLAGDGSAWICVDGDDIWIASSDWRRETPKALSRYNKSTGKWKIYSSTDVLSERYLVKIFRGKKYLWILYHPFAEAGITRYDERTDEWITIKPKADWGGGVTELAEDGDYIWLATMRNGVHRYHFASGTWISYDDKNGLMHNHINDRALKVDGNYIWVGTPRGLSRYDKRDESWTILTEAKTMVGKEVRAVATDSRYVWCGTPVGLSRYDKEYGTWMNFRKRGGMQEMRFGRSTWRWYEPESEEGLINSWVTCLSVDDQYVWIGTRGGANRYDKIANVWDRYTPKNGLPSDDMTTVASDGNTVWMGTNFGLGRFPRTSDDENAWVSYTSGIEIKPGALSKEYAEALVSNEIWCLATDKKYVWIGTKLGVSRYDKRKDMWKTFTTEDGLSSNKVNSIAIQGDYVWFGSDLGVSVYDHKKGDWIHLTQKDGLASNRITSIAINGKDVWCGTLDAGVSRYNTEEKTWRSYKRADGLAHNGIFAISCDVDGSNIWFGTHRGLSRYNKNTDAWTIYTEHYDSEDI